MYPRPYSHRKIVFFVESKIHDIHCRSAPPAFTYISPPQAGPFLSAMHFKRMHYELGNHMILM